LIVLTAISGAASAGPIPAERPSFCQGHTPDPQNHRNIDPSGPEGLSDEVLSRMAMYACDAPDDAGRQKKTAENRQLLADAWGLSPAMTIDSLRARLDLAAYKQESAAFCKKVAKQDDVTARDNGYNAALARLAGCEQTFAGFWLLDEQGDASQVVRLAELISVFDPKHVDKFDATDETVAGKRPRDLTRFARSAVDIARLDRAKLVAELDGNPSVTPRIKVVILEAMDQTMAWTAKVTAAYKAIAAKNHAYQEALFDVPQKAFDDWQSAYLKDQKDFDLVIDVERKASIGRSAVKGCAAKLRPGFARYVADRKLKTQDDFDAFGRDSLAVRWLKALSFCEQVDGNVPQGVFLEHVITAKALRGPREAAELASAKRVAEILADKNIAMDASGVYTLVGDNAGADVLDAFAYAEVKGYSNASATIQALAPKGDIVHISFATASWMEPTMDCVDTKTIERIDVDTGHVQYRRNCKNGPMRKVSVKEAAIDVPAFYASGLKAGQFLTFAVPGIGARSALPLEAFTDQKKTKIVSVFGLAP